MPPPPPPPADPHLPRAEGTILQHWQHLHLRKAHCATATPALSQLATIETSSCLCRQSSTPQHLSPTCAPRHPASTSTPRTVVSRYLPASTARLVSSTLYPSPVTPPLLHPSTPSPLSGPVCVSVINPNAATAPAPASSCVVLVHRSIHDRPTLPYPSICTSSEPLFHRSRTWEARRDKQPGLYSAAVPSFDLRHCGTVRMGLCRQHPSSFQRAVPGLAL